MTFTLVVGAAPAAGADDFYRGLLVSANAVVAARSRIVEGAVGMVEMALNRLTENGVVTLDVERKAAMVSNLMVVLCGDQPPSPVVNAGSLYT